MIELLRSAGLALCGGWVIGSSARRACASPKFHALAASSEFARLVPDEVFRAPRAQAAGRELLQAVARAVDLNNIKVEIEVVICAGLRRCWPRSWRLSRCIPVIRKASVAHYRQSVETMPYIWHRVL